MTPRNRIYPFFIPHEGCPNRCVFCDQWQISGCAAPVTGADVRQQLRELPGEEKYEVAFYGGSFTSVPVSLQDELLSAARDPGMRDKVSAIRVSARPDAVDQAVLSRLKAYGVGTVELGAQSFDDTVLERSGRGHSAADIVLAADRIHENGLRVVLQLMTGLPGSDDDSDLRSAEAAAALAPDGIRLYPTVILAGTELERLWRTGQYREHTPKDAVRICSKIVPLFQKAGIPVLRIGLNPAEGLSAAVVGGAYHPALGEMVLSRVWYDRAVAVVGTHAPAERLVFGVAPGKVSVMTGQHGSNLRLLREKYAPAKVSIRPQPGQDGEEIRLLECI